MPTSYFNKRKLDHTDILGNTVDKIANEKMGIFRKIKVFVE